MTTTNPTTEETQDPAGSTPPPGRSPQPASAAPMSHRAVLEAISGLLLGMFVTMLSSTVVTTALPTIITDLHGSETQYTWVVTATLLAMTASTPIWGKLADLTSKKTLVQIGLVIFLVGSVLAGTARSVETLIAYRALQGLGIGGLTALSQVIMAAIISPRERGRYSGYLGAVFALATVGGPLIGGAIVDTSWLGWRWCFYVGIPFALVALVVLQRTLHLPVVKRKVSVDYLGATLITAAVALLLVWTSFAGHNFDWVSWQSGVMLPGALLLGALFVLVETRAAEPIVPLHLFTNRTITLSTVASALVGVAMFGSTVFLAQYFQISRGASPTESGLMTLPMIAGLFVSSTVSGRVITRTGRWKPFLVAGGVLLTAGFGLMGSIRADTNYLVLAAYMALVGTGLGMLMQNLVLAVQNSVSVRELGVASSVVAFFRSLGGAVGVSVLGAILTHRVADHIADGMATLGVRSGGGSDELPDLAALPAPVRDVVQDAYGHGAGDIFLAATPFALLAAVAVLFIRETTLRRTTHDPEPATVQSATAPPVTAPPVTTPPTNAQSAND